MTNIIKKIVSTGNGSIFKAPNPIYFAVHSTANPGATAANHVNYWRNNPTKAVHLVSDWKEAYQCVDFKYRCNQVGNGNYTCIGLEICEATNKADFERGLEIARDVILQVLNQYGWDIDRHVRSHKWFTENFGGSDHVDPIPYFQKWGWSWDRFIQYLKEGDDMPSAQEVADAVWERALKNPYDGTVTTTSDYLRYASANAALIKDEIFNTSDPTGRESLSTMRIRIAWMAAKQEAQGKLLEKIAEKLGV